MFKLWHLLYSYTDDNSKTGKYEIYLVDAEHNGELITTTDNLELELKNMSFMLIKEI